MKDRTNQQWRGLKQRLFDQAKETIHDLSEYWPLTLRQVYYQLVAAGLIPNQLKA